jgi:hypothetical protein
MRATAVGHHYDRIVAAKEVDVVRGFGGTIYQSGAKCFVAVFSDEALAANTEEHKLTDKGFDLPAVPASWKPVGDRIMICGGRPVAYEPDIELRADTAAGNVRLVR